MVNINQRVLMYPAVLKLLLDYPERRMTVREISIIAKAPYTSISRYVDVLEKVGLIETEKIGSSYSCRLNKNSSLIPEIKKVLSVEISHHRLSIKNFLAKAKKIKSIEKIILFGSVSKGKEKLESDVDIAVVGRISAKDKEKIENISSDILEKDKVSLVIIYLSKADLEKKTQIANDVKKGEVLYDRY